jgi:hypothetical protein
VLFYRANGPDFIYLILAANNKETTLIYLKKTEKKFKTTKKLQFLTIN